MMIGADIPLITASQVKVVADFQQVLEDI